MESLQVNRKGTWLAFGVAAVVCLLFSSLSPLRGGFPGWDSAVFMNMGRAWLEGQTPYRDIFDHKGPVVYLINALGLVIGGGSPYGVFVLELISLGLSFFLVNRLLSRYGLGVVIIVDMILAVVLSHGFSIGNSTEEYAILPSVLSLYLFFRHRRELVYYLVQALLFAVVFLNKPNAAVVVGCVIVFSLVRGLVNRKLLRSIGMAFACAGGVAIVFGSCYLYFWYRGAAREFLDGLLFFSMSYIRTSMLQRFEAFVFFTSTFTLVFLTEAIVVVFLIVRRRWLELFEALFIFGTTLGAVILSGQEFRHYFLIMVPVLVFIAEQFFVERPSLPPQAMKVGSIALLALFIVTMQPNGRSVIGDDVRYRTMVRAYGITSEMTFKSIISTVQTRFYLLSGVKVHQKWFFPLTLTIPGGEDKVAIVCNEIRDEKPQMLLIDAGWYHDNKRNEIFVDYEQYFVIDIDGSIVFKRKSTEISVNPSVTGIWM